MHDAPFWLAAAIFGVTYVGIAFTRLPWVSIDRPSAAFTGAVLMVIGGVLAFDTAVEAIDFHTIALLLGMMLVVASLEREGLVTFMAQRLLSVGSTPMRLLVVVVLGTAVLSAFLLNDAVVLFFTPVLVRTCRLLGVNPIPYLTAEAMASNAGSTATIVGNPQNALIGVTSGISFGRFFLLLLPVALIACAVIIAVIALLYRRDMRSTFAPKDPPVGTSTVPVRALAFVACLIAALFLSSTLRLDVSVVALAAGALVLLLGRTRPADAVRSVDWVLLLFFAGLFVVVGGARQAGVLDVFLDRISLTPDVGAVVSLHAVSAVASQLVSNVPLTLLAIPALQQVPGELLWLSLAASATLAGNITLIGSVANLIVAESAAREGIDLRFGEFLRAGLIVGLLTMTASVAVLSAEWRLGLLS